MSKNLSGVDILTDNAGTVIYNGQITTNKITTKSLTANGNINLTGSIINGSNSITFNDQYEFMNIPKNMHIYGDGFIDYQGTTYNIGQILSAFVGGGTVSPYPSITYNTTSNTTTFTGAMVFPSLSISSASINNSDFATISTSQTLSNKEFSGTTIFNSIQLNSGLILNTGGLTLTNANLQKIQYISGITSDLNTRLTTDETNITSLQTKTTNMTFGSNITTFTGTMVFPQASISFNAIVGTACTLGQNQTITGTKTFSVVQNFTSNLRLDGSLNVGTAGNVVLLNSTLQKIAFISDVSSAVGANLTSLQNQINGINTDLDGYALQSTVQSILDDKIGTMIYYEPTDFNIFKNIASLGEIQYTDSNNNKINIVPIITSSQDKLKNVSRNEEFNYLDISSNCHIYGNLILGNIQNVEYLINSAMTTATAGVTAAGIADGLAVGAGTVAAGAASTAATAVTAVEDLALIVEDHTENLIGLNNKTSQISYSDATDRTTISQTLNSANLEIGNLTSGFTQTVNSQITLAGLLRCNNRVEINNTLELVNNNNIILEGVINQDNAAPPNDGVNQFLAPTNILGTLTVSGNQSNSGNFTTSGNQTSLNSTNTQIGTNAVSTLTINSNTICNGDFTMLSNKNIRLKNILPILLDDIMFGDAIGTYNDYDTIFNTQIIANQSLTLNANFQQGTNISRKTYLGYNDTYTTYASTSATLSSPAIYLTGTNTSITSTATLSVSSVTNSIISTGTTSITGLTTNVDGTFVNIGNVLSTNILYGATYVQALYSPSGTINAIGTVMQQFV